MSLVVNKEVVCQDRPAVAKIRGNGNGNKFFAHKVAEKAYKSRYIVMPHPPITTIFSRLKMTTAGIDTPAGKGEGVYAVDGTRPWQLCRSCD